MKILLYPFLDPLLLLGIGLEVQHEVILSQDGLLVDLVAVILPLGKEVTAVMAS